MSTTVPPAQTLYDYPHAVLSRTGTPCTVQNMDTTKGTTPTNVAEALTFLLGNTIWSTNPDDITTETLTTAAQATMRIRELNSAAGGIILGILTTRKSLREIEELTGIPKSTVQVWAIPPDRATKDET